MMLFKRILSLFLALVLTAGMLPPVTVRADETELPVEEVLEEISEMEESIEETETPEETEAPEETETPTVSGGEIPTVPEADTGEVEEFLEETQPQETTVEILEELIEVSAAQGALAEDLSWDLAEDGTLTIMGTGPIPDYVNFNTPWAGQEAAITRVVIDDGITAIGAYAFHNCTGLTELALSNSITAVGENALPEGADLAIEFDGTLEQWDTLGLDLGVVCLQGSESSMEPETYFIQNEEGQVLELTPEEFAQLPTTFSLARTSVTLSDVKWHRSYTYGTSSYSTWKGMISWKSSAAGENNYTVVVQKKAGSSWEEITAMGVTSSTTYISSDFFVKVIDRMNLSAGNYRYTVRHHGSGTTATSDTYYFPGQPSKKIEKPSGQDWRTFNDYPAMIWNMPSDKSNLYGYEAELSFSSTKNGSPVTVGTISNHGDWYKTQTNAFLQSTFHFERNGAGYYYFRVRNLTANIEKAKNSDWSGWSGVYYYDGGDLFIGNNQLSPQLFPEFSWAEDERSSTLTHDYALYSLLAYSSTKISDGKYHDADEDDRDITLLPDTLEADGFSNIHSYYYSDKRLGGNVTKHYSGDSSYNTTNCVIAHRKINDNADGTDKVVDQVMLVFRGTFWREWYGNFDLTGTDYSSMDIHWSFKRSADETMGFLGDYIKQLVDEKKIDPSNIKITLTGHSRGGAIANLMAHYLTDISDGNGSDIPNSSKFSNVTIGSVHAYTFATPNVATYSYITDQTDYDNIFNYCLTDDFVPNLPLESWSWGKFGRTFWSTAESDLKDSDLVMKKIKEYKGSKPDYNAKNTRGMVEAMTDMASDVWDYYKKDFYIKDGKDKDEFTKLYTYAHDGLGANRAGDGGKAVLTQPLFHVTSDSNLKKLANHIIGGGVVIETPLADTHECYSYYYGTMYAYSTWEESVLTEDGYEATKYSFARAGNAVANPNEAQLAYLRDFLSTQGFTENGALYKTNAERLGWDPENPATWQGLTWDGEGNLIGLDWRTLTITGHLDLTKFPKLEIADLEYCALTELTVAGLGTLQQLDCSGNYLTQLDLTGCTALYDLDCSFNQLTVLDVSGCTDLERLICTDNKLTELDLTYCPRISELACSDNYLNFSTIHYYDPSVNISSDADQQSVSPEAAFNQHDLDALLAIANTEDNASLLEWNPEDPTSWTGVKWVFADGEYHLETVDLRDRKLTGEADFSGCTCLTSLLLSDNDFTRIAIDDCTSLDTLWCERNYLPEENVDELDSLSVIVIPGEWIDENTKEPDTSLYRNFLLTPQRINATFDEADAAGLAELITAMDLPWSADMYTVNKSLSWTPDETGIWHLTGLTMENTGASGELDLSGFESLSRVQIHEAGITALTLPENLTYLNLRGCEGIQNLSFPGSAPTLSSDAFVGMTVSIETPENDPSWKDHFGQSYGGTVNWLNHIYLELYGPIGLPSREKASLQAQFVSNNGTTAGLIWSMDETDSQYATLKPGKNGTATLTAGNIFEKQVVTVTVADDKGLAAPVSLEMTLYPKVQQLHIGCQGLDVTGGTILLDPDTGYSYVNGSRMPDASGLQLYGMVYPSDAMPDVLWSVKGKAATVDPVSGQLFPTGTGTVTLTATATDGSKKSASATVIIGSFVEDFQITTEENTCVYYSIAEGIGESLQLTADTDVTWTLLSGSQFADLTADGLLTAKPVYEPHPIQVQAETKDGALRKTLSVYIAPGDESVLVLRDDYGYNVTGFTIDTGAEGEVFLQAMNLHDDQFVPSVQWHSDNEAVAVVENLANGTAIIRTVGIKGTARITATDPETDRVAFTTIRVADLIRGIAIGSKTGSFRAAAGQKLDLTATLFPSGIRGSVTWSLAPGSEAYASISGKGQLTVKKDLTAPAEIWVLATANDAGAVSVRQSISVTPLAWGLDIRSNEGLLLNGTTFVHDMEETDILRLSADLYPAEADRSITWKSSNTKVAEIDPDSGEVTCLKPGTVTITAATNDGSKLKTTFKLTVIKRVTDIHLDDQTLAGGKSLKLSKLVRISQADATNKTLNWSLVEGDTDFVTLSANGDLKAKAVTEPKAVTIQAETTDGSELYCTARILIYPAVTKVTLWQDDQDVTGKTLTLGVDETLFLDARNEPLNAAQEWNWSYKGKDGILAIGEDNSIHGLTPGSVTLTADAIDGSGKKATVKINVIRKVEELVLSGPDQVAAGKSITLSCDIFPADATNKKLTWSVVYGDVKVSNGRISAGKTTGEALVRATASDGSGVYAEFPVTISPAASQVMLRGDSDLIYTGEEGLALSAEAMPSHAVQDFVWTLSNTRYAAFLDEAGEPVSTVTGNEVTVISLVPGKTVTITATANDGSGVKTTYRVSTVRRMESVTLSPVSLSEGRSVRLTADIFPADTTNKKLIWSLDEASQEYATLSSNGTLRLKNGVSAEDAVSLTVNVSAFEDPDVCDSITVDVHPLCGSVKLYDESDAPVSGTLTRNVGDILELSVKALTKSGDPIETCALQWTSSDSRYVTVEDGTVTVLQPGKTVTIKASALDGSGRSASVKIRTVQLMDSLELPGDVHVAGGKRVTLKPDIQPLSTTSKALTWSFVNEEDKEYASISQSGVLTAKKTDEIRYVEVQAIAKDGSDEAASCTVTIHPAAGSVTVWKSGEDFTGKTIPLYTDETLSLHSVIGPENAWEGCTWKLSGNAASFEAVDGSYADITAVTPGKTVTLTVTANDGTGKKATVRLKTLLRMETIHVMDFEIQGGSSTKLSYDYTPEKVSDDSVKWSIESALTASGQPADAAYLIGGYLFTRRVSEDVTLSMKVTSTDGGAEDYFTVTIKAN